MLSNNHASPTPRSGIETKGRTFTLHGIAVFNSHPPVLNQFSKGPFWLPGLALVATSPFLASSIGKKQALVKVHSFIFSKYS